MMTMAAVQLSADVYKTKAFRKKLEGTSKQYQLAWKRWVLWCDRTGNRSDKTSEVAATSSGYVAATRSGFTVATSSCYVAATSCGYVVATSCGYVAATLCGYVAATSSGIAPQDI
ncbi:hypothetical protein DPMN_148195 [Dreissena polymorpha]|uniref:Uncharacterized protein n=1 Tax=Dreissena polymorpha TaxID=45954 RepID=A0A9D4J3R0_DREPO|nr:hypothetical protein DPMN_148195 [Dreissena polymorpha]